MRFGRFIHPSRKAKKGFAQAAKSPKAAKATALLPGENKGGAD